MMRLNKFAFILILVAALFSSCNDPNVLIDQNTEIDNHNWSYTNVINSTIKVDDNAVPYNIYLNLRVTGDYKYSNIFVLVHQTGPANKTLTTRYEFKLAEADGKWLGQGSGNLYSYQMMFRQGYKFPAKGIYHIGIEQNMRDNPLHEISDVGLRVEKTGAQGQ
jgi:gliding motility-associated lipoprotein GldH